MLDLKLSYSIDCSMNEITPSSNLRDYYPSNPFLLSEMEIAYFYLFLFIFSSISYYLTGSIDNCHKIRTIVDENMLRKLKEACNKFILNKSTNCH